MTVSSSSKAIYGLQDIKLSNATIVSPAAGRVKDGAIVDETGNAAKAVTIETRNIVTLDKLRPLGIAQKINFVSFLWLCTRFFVTLDKLQPLGIAQKINFVSFLWLCTRFFVTLQM